MSKELKVRIAIVSLFAVMAFLLTTVSAFAETKVKTDIDVSVNTGGNINGKSIREEIKEQREEIRDEIKKDREDQKKERKSFLDSLRDSFNKSFRKSAKIVDGEVTAKTGNSLTLTKDGKTYTVNVLSDTKFKRRYWGGTNFADIAVGNRVNVWGKWANEEQTTIDARLIRNLSIQIRRGVFFGEVTSVGDNTLIIKSTVRPDQTVTINSETDIVNREEVAIGFSEILVGHKVRVKGLWNKTANTITEVTKIKNFTLPIISTSPTATPTASPTPTDTP